MDSLTNLLKPENLWIGGLAVLALVAFVATLIAAAGLFGARSLVRRELSAYFLSPIAYVMLVAFLAVIGYRFYLTVDQLTKHGPYGVEYPMQFLFSILPRGVAGTNEWWIELLSGVAFWLVYLLIPPLLTMRLFAEERSSGTLEVLMTAPLRDWQVVLSKYIACLIFYLILWLPTLAFLPVLLNLGKPQIQAVWTTWSILLVGGLGGMIVALLSVLLPLGTAGRLATVGLFVAGAACLGVGVWGHYGQDASHVFEITAGIDPMPVVASYLGLALAGAMFLALGMLISSLVRSQIVAALVSVVLSLVFILAGFWRLEDSTGAFARVLSSFSIPLHFSQDFGRGVVDTRHLVLYSSVALFCLFLTVRSLESRRWR